MIFISHSTKDPDFSIARYFNTNLIQNGYETFFASDNIKIGMVWAEEIDRTLGAFSCFIVFLSENSKISPMVANEIRLARKYYDSKKQGEKPLIIPIRIDMEMNEGINYEIDSHLKDFQQSILRTGKDNKKDILEELLDVLKTGLHRIFSDKEIETHTQAKVYDYAIPMPAAAIEVPGGTCSIESKFYISRRDKERKTEQEFFDHLLTDGSILKIFAPRQFGKTSLFARVKKFAEDNNYYTAAFDFQNLDKALMQNLSQLCRFICEKTALAANIMEEIVEVEIKKYFEARPDTPKDNTTSFFQKFLLPEITKPVVLMIDESDRLFGYPDISEEFFGLLRSWFSYAKAGKVFTKLRIVVVYSTDARYAIQNINQSPFANIPMEFKLEDFSEKEIISLAQLHGLTLQPDQLKLLREQIGGHPFLIRKALYHLSKKHYSFDELIESASSDDGAFADYLKSQFYYVATNPDFTKVIKKIIDSNNSLDQNICLKLKGAGIIKGEVPNVEIKYAILKEYLDEKLKVN